jgi:D-alanyl-lipoteichoic acid acyltransferase DltB (MBOAT superfamily)
MIFNTLEFFLFLFVLLILYYQVRKTHQWFLLLIASSAFLGYLSINFLFYTYLVILINYGLGIIIEKFRGRRKQKFLYLLGIFVNIGQLIFFKYINFLIENLNEILGLIQNQNPVPYLNLILPVGISYYTFECLSYLINVYRGSEKPEKHLGLFASYILFFPKLLAGPIERPQSFLPSLKKPYAFDTALFFDGIIQIFWGLFKKLVIADRLVVLINSIYGNLQDYTGVPLWITLVLQVFHIYCDFSGYTDIVLGIAKLFGIRLTNNFERPLFAQNVSMFWRKWHITLSNWCNDYIFKKILLRRMRWKKWAAVYGVFMTFLIIGIWHGSGWNFIALGALQGIAINYEFFTKKKRIQMASRFNPYWVRFFSRLFVFIFFGFTLVFFNASNLSDALYFIAHLFQNIDWKVSGYNMGMTHADHLIALMGILIVMLFDYLNEKGILIREQVASRPLVKWPLYYGLVIIVLVFGKFGGSDFIYFNF